MEIAGDLHVHSIASGHSYSTIEEIMRAASEKGLKAIAITDHGPAMPGGPHPYFFGNMRALPEQMFGVMLLRGVEANVVTYTGNLDLEDRYLRGLDLVWAGLHAPCLPPGTVEENTCALLGALENPFVDGVVHPGNPDFPVEEEKLVIKAVEQGKIVEINNSSFVIRRGSEERCARVASLAKRWGGKIAINSDAHFAWSLGRVEKAWHLAVSQGFTGEEIINSSLEGIVSFLRWREKKRFSRREAEPK